MAPENLVSEHKSKYGFEKTVEAISSEASRKLWSMPFVHDLQASVAKSGKHIKPVKVIELCKPEYSGKMLELNDERIISVMMPCRVSVYEKEDGITYVGLLNNSLLADSLPANIASVMKTAANEIADIITLICE